MQNAITEVAAMMGENVKLRRGFAMSAPSLGVISTYLHTSPQPGIICIRCLDISEAYFAPNFFCMFGFVNEIIRNKKSFSALIKKKKPFSL